MIALVVATLAQIEWKATFEEARKVAADKKPIAVFVSQKGCALSVELLKNLTKDDRLPEVSKEFAWLAITVGSDEWKKWFCVKCGGTIEGTPALLFLNPKGDPADPEYASLPTVTTSDADEIFPALRQTLGRAKREIPAAQKTKVDEAVSKAKGAATAAEAVAAWKLAIRLGDGWKAVEAQVAEARAGIEKKLQEGCAEIVRIQQSVRDAAEARKAYEAVKAGYAGTVVADLASEELKRLK
jgi:hypothetical protein